jgi:alpha-tubulin suppressor-like RCC1 family protein
MSSKFSTELFVWGCDQMGQLGLGHRYNQKDDKKYLPIPKSCSFNIQIQEVSCGEDFTFLLTEKGLVYGMGSNQFGKLGLFYTEETAYYSTPKLVESLSTH